MSGILKRKSASGDGFSTQEIRTKQTRLVPLGSYPVFVEERTPTTPHPATGSAAARVAKGKFKPLVQSTLAFGNSPSTGCGATGSSSRDRKLVAQKKMAPIIKVLSKKASESKVAHEEAMELEDSEDDGRWGRNELSFIRANKHQGFGERAKRVDRKGKGKAPRLDFVEAGENIKREATRMNGDDHDYAPSPVTPPRDAPEMEEEPDTEDDFEVVPTRTSPLVLAGDSDEDSDASMEVRNLLITRRQSISPVNQQHPRTDDSGFADGAVYSGKVYESEEEEGEDEREDDGAGDNCTAEVEAQLLCLVPDTQDQDRPSPIKASLYSPESCFLGGVTQYPVSPTPSSPLTALSHSPVLSPCRIAPRHASPPSTTPQSKLTGFASVDQAWAGRHISPPQIFSPRQSRVTEFFAGPTRDDDDIIIADSQALPFFLDAIKSAAASTSRKRRLAGVAEAEEPDEIIDVEEREKEIIVPTSDAEDEPEIPLDEDVEFLTRLGLGKFSRRHLDRPSSPPSPAQPIILSPQRIDPSPHANEVSHPSSAPDERFLPESMLHFLGEFDETEESMRR